MAGIALGVEFSFKMGEGVVTLIYVFVTNKDNFVIKSKGDIFMKKNCKTLLLAALFVIAGMGMAGCKQNVDTSAGEYWKNVQTVEGNDYSVTLTSSKDINFIAWTKENGEFLEVNNGQMFKDTLLWKKGQREYTYTFPSAGTYILNICQGGDVDYRGKVVVGEKAIKIADKDYAETCPNQSVYWVLNDSNNKNYGTSGNVITELIYVKYKQQWYDRARKDNFGLYDVQFKYTGVDLKVGEKKMFVFPMTPAGDTRYGGLILKPFVKDGKTIYVGQTTNREGTRYSAQGGLFPGQSNGIHYMREDGLVECVW